jgi:hypothetical protein
MLILGLILLLICVIPASCGPIQNSTKRDSANLVDTIIFEDNFDNGVLNPDKWTIIGNGAGSVEVVNGRLEIQCYEGNPTNWVGVRSTSFGGTITEDKPLIITLQMISYISHFGGFVGNQNIKITDDTNSVNIGYFRLANELLVGDSGGNSALLFIMEETSIPWSVEIQIYVTGGYKVTVNGYSTEVTESIFTGSSFHLELVVSINGDFPSYWYRAAFDEVSAKDKSNNNMLIKNTETQFKSC